MGHRKCLQKMRKAPSWTSGATPTFHHTFLETSGHQEADNIKVTQHLPDACAAPISVHTWGRDRDVNYVPCLCINRVRPTIVLTSFKVSFMLFWNIPPLIFFCLLFCCTRVIRHVACYSRVCVCQSVFVKHSMFLSLLKKRDFHIVPESVSFVLRRNSVRRYIRQRYHGWASRNSIPEDFKICLTTIPCGKI